MTDIIGEEGQSLEVSYEVDNTGDSDYTQDIQLLRDGIEVDSDTGVTLAPSDSVQTGTLSWETTEGDAGTYTMEVVSNDDSESFTAEVTSASVGSLIDSFEDEDFSEYTDNGDGTQLTTGTTFVTDGSYGMEISRNGATDGIVSLQGGGLDYYPKPGDTYRFDYQTDGGDTILYHGFLLQGTGIGSGTPAGYNLEVRPTDNSLTLYKDWNDTELGTDSVTINTGTQYMVEVSIAESDGTITCSLLDSSDTELGSIQTTDADAASGGAYDANYGIAFSQNDTSNSNETTYIDYIRTVGGDK